jgi:hypothetical protein
LASAKKSKRAEILEKLNAEIERDEVILIFSSATPGNVSDPAQFRNQRAFEPGAGYRGFKLLNIEKISSLVSPKEMKMLAPAALKKAVKKGGLVLTNTIDLLYRVIKSIHSEEHCMLLLRLTGDNSSTSALCKGLGAKGLRIHEAFDKNSNNGTFTDYVEEFCVGDSMPIVAVTGALRCGDRLPMSLLINGQYTTIRRNAIDFTQETMVESSILQGFAGRLLDYGKDARPSNFWCSDDNYTVLVELQNAGTSGLKKVTPTTFVDTRKGYEAFTINVTDDQLDLDHLARRYIDSLRDATEGNQLELTKLVNGSERIVRTNFDGIPHLVPTTEEHTALESVYGRKFKRFCDLLQAYREQLDTAEGNNNDLPYEFNSENPSYLPFRYEATEDGDLRTGVSHRKDTKGLQVVIGVCNGKMVSLKLHAEVMNTGLNNSKDMVSDLTVQ